MQKIQLLKEDLLTAAEAVAHRALAGRRGRKAHLGKFYRLISVGAMAEDGNRVVLESVRLPSGTCTSRQAIERFIHKLNTAHHRAKPVGDDREETLVDRKLDDLGL